MITPDKIEEILASDFKNYSGEDCLKIERMKGDASMRSIYRIFTRDSSIVGVYGPDFDENQAFLSFSRTFEKLDLPAVKLLYQNKNGHSYLLEDLGDTTLFQWLTQKRNTSKEFPEDEALVLYEVAVENLAGFQILAADKIDYKKCFQTDSFDHQAWLTDINYFLELFVLQLVPDYRDYEKLQKELYTFLDLLEKFERDYFIYRDFQSRNIMVTDKGLRFLDYQAGRRGFLSYDIASILVDARADLPLCFRDKVLSHYIKSVEKLVENKRDQILDSFAYFSLIRVLQAMGSYGNNGIRHKKHEHLTSVPYALKNGLALLNSDPDLNQLKTLHQFFEKILANRCWEKFLPEEK